MFEVVPLTAMRWNWRQVRGSWTAKDALQRVAALFFFFDLLSWQLQRPHNILTGIGTLNVKERSIVDNGSSRMNRCSRCCWRCRGRSLYGHANRAVFHIHPTDRGRALARPRSWRPSLWPPATVRLFVVQRRSPTVTKQEGKTPPHKWDTEMGRRQ